MNKQLFISDIKLTGDDEFARKFNNLSDLWTLVKEAKTKEEEDEAWNNYFNAKLALELGY